MTVYQDRIDARAFRRRERRERMSLWLFLAFIYLAGLVTGWCIQTVNAIK